MKDMTNTLTDAFRIGNNIIAPSLVMERTLDKDDGWKHKLKGVIESDEVEELENPAVILPLLFADFVYPNVSSISLSSRAVYVPEHFYVKVDGGHKIFQLLSQPDLFHALPSDLKIGFLDILYLILRRSVYDVIRLQARLGTEKNGFFSKLIKLLSISNAERSSNQNLDALASQKIPLYISKRIIRLISVVGSAGVSVEDVSSYMRMLRFPSELSNSLLQAFNVMIKNEVSVLKAYPKQFFSFGGEGAGIAVNGTTCPFTRELQFFTWFRIESFDSHSSSSNGRSHQHLLNIVTVTGKGLSLYLDDKYLALSLLYGPGSDTVFVRIDQPLRRGVWYHISIRHSKPPRLSLFARDELTIHLDNALVLQESFRFPNLGGELCDIICAQNFDGQMGPIYLLQESLPQSAIDHIARSDAGKQDTFSNKDGKSSKLNTAADLIPIIVTSDKKAIPLTSKIALTFHPDRCANQYALDIFQNRHGKFGKKSFVWRINTAKEAINSLGGVPVILPLLPRLFVENEIKRNEVMAMYGSVGLGSSLGDIIDPMDNYCLLDSESIETLESDMADLTIDGSLSTIFSILANCLSTERNNQKHMNIIGGFDMIEYALRCLSPQILESEGETCVLSLLSLRTAVADNSELDEIILRRLLSNLDIWSKASYKLQSSLMSVLLASIKAQPGYYLSVIGVQGIVDSLWTNYMEQEDDTEVSIAKQSPVPESSNTPAHSEHRVTFQVPSTNESKNKAQLSALKIPDSPEAGSTILSVPATPTSPLPNLMRRPSLSNFKSVSSSSFKIALNKELCSEFNLDEEEEAVPESPRRTNLSPISEPSETTDGSAIDVFSIKSGSVDDLFAINDKAVESISKLSFRTKPEEDKSDSFLKKESFNTINDGDKATDHIEILSKQQRKHIRNCLGSMITSLILFSPTEKEIRPLLDFMVFCKNSEVLHEMCELLLYLVVEGGAAVIIAITTATKGPEEFASFVIFHLIHQSDEAVRCMGIRLLTHYYVRLDLVPANVLSLALKRRKGGMLMRTVETLAVNLSPSENQSLHRLAVCGGLTLLTEIITSHSKTCTDQTYYALLEMLLTKEGTRSQVTIKHTDLFQGISPTAEVLQPSLVLTQTQSKLGAGSNSTINGNNSPNRSIAPVNTYEKGFLSYKQVIFSAHYLSPDLVHDEGANIVNSDALQIFFEILPKLRLKIHDIIYNDLLALLKHSFGNRDAFCENPLWHVCMMEMVQQLVSTDKLSESSLSVRALHEAEALSTEKLLYLLEYISEPSTPLDLHDISPLQKTRSKLTMQLPRVGSGLSEGTASTTLSEIEDLMDTNFSIGMKVFATLLLHCIDRKGGWKELESAISHSYTDKTGYLATETVLSHMISELTFSMRSKYRDLQKLAKSANQTENSEAIEKLENLLSVMLISSQFTLLDVPSVVQGIPELDIAKMRVRYFNSVQATWASPFQTLPGNKSNEKEGSGSPGKKGSVNEDEKEYDGLNANSSFKGLESRRTYSKDLRSSDGITAVDAEESQTPLDASEDLVLIHLGRDRDTYTGLISSFEGTINPNEKSASVPGFDTSSSTIQEKIFDFSHIWYDISGGSVTSLSPKTQTHSPQGMPTSKGMVHSLSTPDLKRNISKKQELFARDNLLRPLERGHSSLKGKLVLALQTLRFFDTIFWPHESGTIRNSVMLKFQIEKHVAPSYATSASGKRPQSAAFATNGNAPHETHSQPTLTLFSGVMRMCLYILSTLSPMSDLATLNLQRIKALIESSDKVSSTSTPINDWILVVLLHVTINLQRITQSFVTLFDRIGLKPSRLSVPSVGIRDNAFEFSERERITLDEITLEKALNDVGLSSMLQSLFDNAPGKQLLDYVKSSLAIIVTIFESKRDFLARTMEDRTLYWLEGLVDKLKADLNIFLDIRIDMLATANNTSSDIISAPKEKAKNPLKWKSTSPIPTITEENISRKIRSYTAALALDINYSEYKSKTTEGPMRRHANSMDNMSEVASEYSERTADTSAESGNKNIRVTTPLPGTDNEENSVLARDVVTMLAWLREPYFRCNLLRSIGVAKSVMALEHHESNRQDNYTEELNKIQQSLKAFRDLNSVVTEEIMELKEISTMVTTMMRGRESSRIKAKMTVDALRLKQVASSWQECIHDFEADWSPWYHQEYCDAPIPGRAYFELSRLKDTRMRRMALTRLPESIDHDDAAYTEGKIRDQLTYASQVQGGAPNTIQEPSAAEGMSFLKQEIKNLSNIRKNQQSAWDDEEEDDEGKDIEGDAGVTEANPGTAMLGTTGNRQSASNIAEVIGGAASLVMNPFFTNTNFERPLWAQAFHWEADERMQIILEATQIQLQQVVRGTLMLTNKHLYFHPKIQTGGLGTSAGSLYDQRWHLDRLVETYGRRYLLQSCAIELFFLDTLEVFFAFKSLHEVKLFFRHLRRQNVPLLSTAKTLNPMHLCQQSAWTELWRKRLISNYEYLMRLNIIAGRSYNDITQYPVFPWILADYSSSELDLGDPTSFRDLRKPVGALNGPRLQEFLERYRSFDDDDEIPRFMYGSHYSSAGVVLHYLIRQEPFTTMGINLQGGRFDCPDRIFFDLQRTWSGCNSSMSDVKELIPEFFCSPEMFINTNKLKLGELQEGGKVDDVILPPWAKDAFDFIRIHREALESDYVSDHLHEWIDLVFGYKQTGPAAIEAHNVFYYLTYENAINIDAIEDPLQREATKAQVIHFGQTPSQLFGREHPRRLPRKDCLNALCSGDISQLSHITAYTPPKQFALLSGGELGAAISVQCSGDRLVAVHADLSVTYYRWSTFPDNDGTPFTLRPEKKKTLPSESLSYSLEIISRRRQESSENQSFSSTSSKITSDSDSSKDDRPKDPPSLAMATSGIFSMFRQPVKPSSSPSLKSKKQMSRENSLAETINPVNSTGLGTSRGHISNQIAVTLDEASNGRIISCGYWDQALKAHAVDSLKEISSVNNSTGHSGQITCVQVGYQGGLTVITGGVDGTCRVWVLENPALALSYAERQLKEHDLETSGFDSSLQCVRVLWGHSTAITDLSYSSELDIVMSSSSSGLLCLHTVRQGTYLRSIRNTLGQTINKVLASSSGYLVAHSSSHRQLHLFWINGQHLASVGASVRVEAMAVNGPGTVLVCGLSDGTLSLRTIWNLEEVHVLSSLAVHGSIASLWFTDDMQFLLVGSEDGFISVVTDPDSRWKMLHSTIQKTPLLGPG